MARPSKEHTYLTQSICFIPWPIYGIVMPWLACFFSCASSSKTCTTHTSQVGKLKLAKPTADQRINPCQIYEVKFSASSNFQAAIGAVSLPFLGFLLVGSSRGHFGIFWLQLGAAKKLNRWLKRNEHEPESTEAMNKLKCTTCTSL